MKYFLTPYQKFIYKAIKDYIFCEKENLNPIFLKYINLELLKYLLSIGSNVACRIYFNNKFCDCIVIANDIGFNFSYITKVERTSFFKIMQRCINTESTSLTFYIKLQC